jgi:hypothetical protein
MKNEKIANNQEKIKALHLAEIQLTDKEDYTNCVKDMVRSASLDKSEAKIVANAIRSKFLPSILREAGFEEADVKPMVKTDMAEETEDFAADNETEDDDMEEMHHFEDDEDDLEEDDTEDLGEADDEDMAKFEIEVPADMVDAAKQAVQEALDNLLGGEDESDMDDEDMEDQDLDDEDFDDDIEDEDMEDEDEDMEEDSEQKMHTSSIGVNKMTKQALAARRAQREAILNKIASEEESYPASSTLKSNSSPITGFEGEIDYPVMVMEGSEGNSLKEQNPSWADQHVPTMNPESIQQPEYTKPSKFDSSGSKTDGMEFVVDWNALEAVPSEGVETDLFEIPSQMPNLPRKTTIPAIRAAQTEKVSVQCTSCGNTMSMTEEEMNDPNTKCHHCEKEEDNSDDVESATDVTFQNGQPKLHVSALETARIKTAYSCSSKLALAGIIESAEIDSYAEQMLNDELKADAMIRQTKLLLSAAQASTERVAAAAAERMSVRTASSNGISTSPAFNSSSSANNSAALDIQSALKGTWTMPNIED